MLSTNNLAQKLCEAENGKQQVNIAQMNEIAAKLRRVLADNYSINDILTWLAEGYFRSENTRPNESKLTTR